MAAQKLNVTPEIVELISKWKQAKDSEQQWVEYRRSLEDALTASLKDQIDEVQVDLAAGTSLTKTVKVGELELQVGSELKVKQEQMAEFVSHYPYLIGPVIKMTYAPISTKGVLETLKAENEMAKDLSQAVERKEKRPYYSLKK